MQRKIPCVITVDKEAEKDSAKALASVLCGSEENSADEKQLVENEKSLHALQDGFLKEIQELSEIETLVFYGHASKAHFGEYSVSDFCEQLTKQLSGREQGVKQLLLIGSESGSPQNIEPSFAQAVVNELTKIPGFEAIQVFATVQPTSFSIFVNKSLIEVFKTPENVFKANETFKQRDIRVTTDKLLIPSQKLVEEIIKKRAAYLRAKSTKDKDSYNLTVDMLYAMCDELGNTISCVQWREVFNQHLAKFALKDNDPTGYTHKLLVCAGNGEFQEAEAMIQKEGETGFRVVEQTEGIVLAEAEVKPGEVAVAQSPTCEEDRTEIIVLAEAAGATLEEILLPLLPTHEEEHTEHIVPAKAAAEDKSQETETPKEEGIVDLDFEDILEKEMHESAKPETPEESPPKLLPIKEVDMESPQQEKIASHLRFLPPPNRVTDDRAMALASLQERIEKIKFQEEDEEPEISTEFYCLHSNEGYEIKDATIQALKKLLTAKSLDELYLMVKDRSIITEEVIKGNKRGDIVNLIESIAPKSTLLFTG